MCIFIGIAHYKILKIKSRIEELADVYEIISALAKLENSSINEVALVAKSKADKRGSFDKKVYLEEVEENEQ